MYTLLYTSKFKKDLKKVKSNKLSLNKVVEVLKILQKEGVSGIPKQMKPHKLTGNYNDCIECHIKPDLLIIWLQFDDTKPKVIKLVRLGNHGELF